MVENPDELKAVLKYHISNLENVQLKEIKLIYGEDVNVYLTFDIEGLKNNFPKKWLENEFDTLQITILLVSSDFVNFEHNNLVDCKGSFRIETSSNFKKVNFIFDENKSLIQIKAKWIYINKVSAYKSN